MAVAFGFLYAALSFNCQFVCVFVSRGCRLNVAWGAQQMRSGSHKLFGLRHVATHKIVKHMWNMLLCVSLPSHGLKCR